MKDEIKVVEFSKCFVEQYFDTRSVLTFLDKVNISKEEKKSAFISWLAEIYDL